MSLHILAFDTSSATTAVAVLRDDQVLSQDAGPSKVATGERGSHAQTLLPRIQSCLAAAQLTLSEIDLIGVGIGPGSFTGVRVGLATAKGFVLASGTKLRGVVSLAALARAAFDSGAAAPGALVAPLLDAHKAEVFAALYGCDASGELQVLVTPFHAAPERAALCLREALLGCALHVLGSGYRRYAEQLSVLLGAARVLDEALDEPSGAALAREARRGFLREGPSDASTLVPMYLRDSDAQLPKAPLRMS